MVVISRQLEAEITISNTFGIILNLENMIKQDIVVRVDHYHVYSLTLVQLSFFIFFFLVLNCTSIVKVVQPLSSFHWWRKTSSASLCIILGTSRNLIRNTEIP